MDLADYAANALPGGVKRRRCMTCALDEQIIKQINMAREASPKIPFTVISKWLKEEHGVSIQHNTIRNHFVAGHNND